MQVQFCLAILKNLPKIHPNVRKMIRSCFFSLLLFSWKAQVIREDKKILRT